MKLNSKLSKLIFIAILSVFFCILYQQYCYADLIVSPYIKDDPMPREELIRPIDEEKIENNKILLIIIFSTAIGCLYIWHKYYKINNKDKNDIKIEEQDNNISKALNEKIVIEQKDDKLRIEITLQQLLAIIGALGLIIIFIVYIICN